MLEIRVVRTNLYPLGSPPTTMQGHYFRGETFYDALNQAFGNFPNELLSVRIWKRFKPDFKQEPLQLNDEHYQFLRKEWVNQ